MSRSRAKHRQERKRRHERQIAEGMRVLREKTERPTPRVQTKRRALLSEMDAGEVKEVLRLVRDLRFDH